MENCSIYSHHIWFKEVVDTIKSSVAEDFIEIKGELDAWESIVIFGIKNGQKSTNKMTLTCRTREIPSFELGDPVVDITTNLNGMRNYFGSIQGGKPIAFRKNSLQNSFYQYGNWSCC